jgi:CRISPR system Cascade subunit CasE
LRANPTVKRKPLGEPDGKRLGLLREEDQLAWLDRQAARHGFSVHGVTASRDEFINGSKPGHTIKFFAVRFDGLLQVVQSDLFGRALVDGIGPAKAFGCGLLSLAPAGG